MLALSVNACVGTLGFGQKYAPVCLGAMGRLDWGL